MNVLVIGGTHPIGSSLVQRPTGLGHMAMIAPAEAVEELRNDDG